MKRGIFEWNTTSTTDSRMLYLTVMRDLKKYCARGYCDTLICLTRFLIIPSSLLKRTYRAIPPRLRRDHYLVFWSDYGMVASFMSSFFSIIAMVTHTEILKDDYEKALEEFTQGLKKK